MTTTTRSTTATAASRAGEPRVLPVLTLVMWLACLTIGGLGFAYPYARPQPRPAEPVIVAQRIQVELTGEPLPPVDRAPVPPDPAAPPKLPDKTVVAAAPPLLAVAEPSPALAFALPVEGPVRVVESAQAAFARPAVTAPVGAPTPVPQTLTFGQGDGRQPAPEYPLVARRRGQEGTVLVRFTVGADGRVLATEAVQPSPWPLLNDAALVAIRERWRFSAGPVRWYEVPIQFVLKK